MLQLREDAAELQRLLETATRQRAKDCLTVELRKVETLISQQMPVSQSNENQLNKPAKSTAAAQNRVLPIKTYGKITFYQISFIDSRGETVYRYTD